MAAGEAEEMDLQATIRGMATDWHMAVSACAFLLEHMPVVAKAMAECESVFLAAERVAGGGCSAPVRRRAAEAAA